MNSYRISAETWSVALQQQTRDALEEMPCTPNGLMHFKHKQHGYATKKKKKNWALEELFRLKEEI